MTQEKLKHEDISKWKTSKDKNKRFLYWVNYLSPHNLWTAYEELEEIKDQAYRIGREDEREWILKELHKAAWLDDDDRRNIGKDMNGEMIFEGDVLKDHNTGKLLKVKFGYFDENNVGFFGEYINGFSKFALRNYGRHRNMERVGYIIDYSKNTYV